LISRKASLGLLFLITAVIVCICCMLPRIPQPASYHLFADRRPLLGIPNFGDVASNLPFAVIGIWGLVFLGRCRSNRESRHFLDPRELWPYAAVFAGLVLTAFGSSWYHLNPNNATLVWDRLPMTITFMGMVAAVIMERISLRLGLLLPVLLAIGLMSVLQWNWSEMRGAGDLRFYAAVQAWSALVILLALFFPARYTEGRYLGFLVGFYALAKVLELFDKPIFAALRVVSGHTLKHLAAAAAGYSILLMVEKRQPVPEPLPVSQTI
jgi:hypothetical protein